MALYNCPECGKEISDQAKGCPNCGFTINKKLSPKKMSKNARILLIILPVLLVVLGAGLYFGLQYLHEQEQNKAIAAVSALISNGQYDEAENQIAQMKSDGFNDEKLASLYDLLEEHYTSIDEQFFSEAKNAIDSGDFIKAKNAINNMSGYIDFTLIQFKIDEEMLNRLNDLISLAEKTLEDYQVVDLSSGLAWFGYDNGEVFANNLLILCDDVEKLNNMNDFLQNDIPKDIISESFITIYENTISLAMSTITTFDAASQASLLLGSGGVSSADISSIKSQLSGAKVELNNANNQFKSIYETILEE